VEFSNLSTKYLGDVATTYNAERVGQKWQSEQAAADELLGRVPDGATVLDVPVGTGRLMEFYKSHKFDVTGLDISPDMIGQARAAAEANSVDVKFQQGDIRSIPFGNDTFDLVVCLRFLNWIDKDGVAAALGELARVSSRNVLIGIRYLTAWGDMSVGSKRFAMRTVGIPRYRARKWGLVYHEKSFVHDQIKAKGLRVVESRHVERRWDGTDYVFFLLEKERTKPSA
jgi:ubiquinone/menaquinone biosynthesis C-methylase UbiE